MGQNSGFNIQSMCNEYDMLKGCINRIFITDDREELLRMRDGAKFCIDRLFELGIVRVDKEKEANFFS